MRFRQRFLRRPALSPCLGLLALCGALVLAGPVAAGDGKSAAAHAAPESTLAPIRRLRDRQQWLPALARIEQAAMAYPDDAALYRLRVLVLSGIGARQRAWALYRARPGLFDAGEARRIEEDRLARRITWSKLFVADERNRFDEGRATDRAIDQYLAANGMSGTTVSLRLRYDRLLLLNHLARHQEVADEYARLQAQGHAVPGYALAAVGDSLLALRRPEDAAIALQGALRSDPDNANVHVQHAYAELESERFDRAWSELAALSAANPPWLREPVARRDHPNWNRYHADFNLALARAYGEDLAGSQATLESLLSIAPNNAAMQAALGSIYQHRGWPSQALARNRIAGSIEPRNVQARIGQGEALIALQRDDLVHPIRTELLATYPDLPQVQLFDRNWRAHRGWQWRVHAAGGRSGSDSGSGSASPLGSRDGGAGFEVAGPILGDRWRLLAGSDDHWADFRGTRVHDRRFVIGVRYAFGRLDWQLLANRAFDSVDDNGLALDLGWRFSDVLDASFSLRASDPEASLQARAAGITADSARVGFGYQPSESTAISASAQLLRYDDGNRRQAFDVSVDQRLLTRPHFRLNGLASASTSRGSRGDAPYFNPARDRSVRLGLRADHLAWRRYERHFRQRLSASIGPYWQQGFGHAWVPSLRYEHQWRLGPGEVLAYGVDWSRPVYDGTRERRLGFDAEFRWGG